MKWGRLCGWRWRRRRCWAWLAVVCLAATCAALQSPMGSLLGGNPRYSFVLALANHKTGTVQLMCLGRHASKAIGAPMLFVPLDGLYSTKNVDALLAQAAAAQRRPAWVMAQHHPAQRCHGRAASPGRFVCPRPDVPCADDGTPTLSLDGCDLALRLGGSGGVAHFYRNPWDVVVSAYWYHMQQPAPEAWLNQTFGSVADAMLATGVPPSALHALEVGGQEHRNSRLGELLGALPEARGVQLQFWNSAPEMFAMARQFILLRDVPAAVQVRFEAAAADFGGVAHSLLATFYSQEDVAAAFRTNLRVKCDPTQWPSEERASNNHVTSSKHGAEDKRRLQGVLAEQPAIRAHLCALSTALGYGAENAAWCG